MGNRPKTWAGDIYMSYKPDHFELYELLPRNFYMQHSKKSHTILWGLFDERILWTADQIRKKYGKMSANTWYWGGRHQYRGFRPFDCTIGSEFSQHKWGRGVDLDPKECSPEEIRQDIKDDKYPDIFKYITCIEDFKGMSWIHLDCRNWNKEKNGLLIVGK